jgi:DNA-binding LacI/PurR family transcriptional regulator
MQTNSQQRTGRRILLYSGEDPKAESRTMFYLNLFWQLITQGRKKGYEMVPYIDTRAVEQRVICPPELKDSLQEMHLDGVICMLLHRDMTAWMSEGNLPFTGIVAGLKGYVELDMFGMLSASLCRLAELGCHSVGLMYPATGRQAEVVEFVERQAKVLNLEIKYEWMLLSRQSREITGYNHFISLWNLKSKPDGLLVYPDETARGVVSAIVEKQIRVPEELKLVIHRNAESPYFVPFCCDFMENSVVALGEALFEDLECVWAGKSRTFVSVPFQLVKNI